MTVRVRMFAALREAAGEPETSVPAGDLSEVLDALGDRYGPTFTQRLAVASVLVDGVAAHRADDPFVPEGSEIALLPPVSGGEVAVWVTA